MIVPESAKIRQIKRWRADGKARPLEMIVFWFSLAIYSTLIVASVFSELWAMLPW